MVIMNRLSTADRVRVVAALVEGNSIRATVRMTGVAKNTITKLLAELGEACAAYQGEHLVNLPCKRIQCDEIWSFVGMKQKNAPAERAGEVGDVWTWVGLDADTKLVASFMVGLRDAVNARAFMEDLASRLANRVQLTTDGHKAYLTAVDAAFGGEVDYAMLVKVYGTPLGATATNASRYSPNEVVACEKHAIRGKPAIEHVSTSFVERQNLTMRMGMRRFTRLTNGFSKKVENHMAAIALHFMHYNYCRIHQSLRVTPAMAAGVSDHVWELDELIGLLG
jgi:IS1 family transposase